MKWLIILLLSCISPQQNSVLKISNNKSGKKLPVNSLTQPSTWVEIPNIRVCNDTKINIFRVKNALQYWKRLGYKFGDLSIDRGIICKEPIRGEILITIPSNKMDSKHLAATQIYTEKNTPTIAMAKIYIYPRVARIPRALEHEIGHALGWRHYNQRHHIMHPDWISGGYDSTGLRKK